MPWKGVTLVLLQGTVLSPASLNTWRAHAKARAPAVLLQKCGLIFYSLFLPGGGQQRSCPQLQRSKIREAPWHQVARGSCARKQSPVPISYPPGLVLTSSSHPIACCPIAPLHAQQLCWRPLPTSLAVACASGAASCRKMKINSILSSHLASSGQLDLDGQQFFQPLLILSVSLLLP